MTGPHTDTATLLDFIDDASALSRAEQLHVAQHLTSGCATCWSAVDLLPSVEPFRPSDTAMREALLHLVCAESRALLPGGQLGALARVRRTPTGFAQLLLAEALSIGLAIHGEIATLHALRGARAEMACAETAAREALGLLRNGPDSVLATGAVLRDAELTQQLAMIVPPGHVLRRQGVRQAADALREKADDFDRFTDALTRAQRHLCLARLFLGFDRPEAAASYQRAAQGFRSCQADDHYFNVLAEEVMARLMGDLLDDTGVRDSWTPQELEYLISAVTRSSIWMDVNAHAKPD